MLTGMESNREPRPVVDLTGLSVEDARSVEALVTALREEETRIKAFSSSVEWCRALREWAESHRRLEHVADWSREAVYAGPGE
jgi:hypothetical protein